MNGQQCIFNHKNSQLTQNDFYIELLFCIAVIFANYYLTFYGKDNEERYYSDEPGFA